MERNVQVFGGGGVGASYGVARERLVLRNSNPFMQSPLVSLNKKALSTPSTSSSSSSVLLSSAVNVPLQKRLTSVVDVSPKKEEKSQRKVLLTFEEEQAAIAERNDREEQRLRVSQHLHKLALKANSMGVFHERIGRLDKAFECYQVALKSVQETKTSVTRKPFMCTSFTSKVIPRSCKTPIVINNTNLIRLEDERTFITAVILCNLGSMYRRSNQLLRAMEFYNLAYKIVGGTSSSGSETYFNEEAEILQARMLEYIEGNVLLISNEQDDDDDDDDDDEEDDEEEIMNNDDETCSVSEDDDRFLQEEEMMLMEE